MVEEIEMDYSDIINPYHHYNYEVSNFLHSYSKSRPNLGALNRNIPYFKRTSVDVLSP